MTQEKTFASYTKKLRHDSHALAVDLGLDEVQRKALLDELVGKTSALDMTDIELEYVNAYMRYQIEINVPEISEGLESPEFLDALHTIHLTLAEQNGYKLPVKITLEFGE